MKKVDGIKSTSVNFPNKLATVEFDESVISAQEVSRAAFQSPHMMGKDMKYGAFLMLSVPGANKDKTTQAKAKDALTEVKGVANMAFYPKLQAVAIEFAATGKVTSKQLIEALDKAGWKAAQYGAKTKK